MGVEIVKPVQIGSLTDNQSMRGKKCFGCHRPMLSHWILRFKDPVQYKKYYCYRDGTSYAGKWGRK